MHTSSCVSDDGRIPFLLSIISHSLFPCTISPMGSNSIVKTDFSIICIIYIHESCRTTEVHVLFETAKLLLQFRIEDILIEKLWNREAAGRSRNIACVIG